MFAGQYIYIESNKKHISFFGADHSVDKGDAKDKKRISNVSNKISTSSTENKLVEHKKPSDGIFDGLSNGQITECDLGRCLDYFINLLGSDKNESEKMAIFSKYNADINRSIYAGRKRHNPLFNGKSIAIFEELKNIPDLLCVLEEYKACVCDVDGYIILPDDGGLKLDFAIVIDESIFGEFYFSIKTSSDKKHNEIKVVDNNHDISLFAKMCIFEKEEDGDWRVLTIREVRFDLLFKKYKVLFCYFNKAKKTISFPLKILFKRLGLNKIINEYGERIVYIALMNRSLDTQWSNIRDDSKDGSKGDFKNAKVIMDNIVDFIDNEDSNPTDATLSFGSSHKLNSTHIEYLFDIFDYHNKSNEDKYSLLFCLSIVFTELSSDQFLGTGSNSFFPVRFYGRALLDTATAFARSNRLTEPTNIESLTMSASEAATCAHALAYMLAHAHKRQVGGKVFEKNSVFRKKDSVFRNIVPRLWSL